MLEQKSILFAAIVAALGIIYGIYLIFWILKKPEGSDKMREVAKAIQEGASAFLGKQYRTIAIIGILIFIILFWLMGIRSALGFLIGAIFSILSGYIGMNISVRANVRTTQAAKSSLAQALQIAFRSGAVMGLLVVSFGLLVVVGFYLLFKDVDALIALGFGGSLVALFARVGGGIYTKAADVGADMVGKVEAGIPEDDPRNPAVIADNVGDNVGDVAGMGADLYESYVDSIVVAMILGVAVFAHGKGLAIPLILAGVGLVSSILGTLFVRVSKSGAHSALNKGVAVSTILMVILSFVAVKYFLGDLGIFYATVTGLLAGVIIGLSTQYYTSEKNKPAKSIAESAQTGAGPNIISGLAVGMISTVIPVLTISVAILLAFWFLGLFGIAIAAVGMLSTLGMTLAADTYGPVADNAAGIAEMADVGDQVRKRAEELDAVGNTTAAIGKGFAIGSAVLTALALFAGYTQIVNLSVIDVIAPKVMVGLLIGAVMPFIFSSMTMKAVGEAAIKIVEEVRRQFKEIPGLMAGKAKPDYQKCVAISTSVALRQMILPSLLAVLIPILTGFILGAEALGGLLVGAIATGFLMAVMMANAGGAWDNAKKYIEAGNLGGKGSNAHKAAVVGDTVGDPFKDTSGPSLNILIKLMSIVALLIARFL